MLTAYFSTYKLNGRPGGPQQPWPADWAASLARQQEIYEELLASQELERRQAAKKVARRRPLSMRKITQNLAGWSPPGASTLGR